MKFILFVILLPVTLLAFNPVQNTSKFTPNVSDKMLKANFWTAKLSHPDKVLMTDGEIQKFNAQNIKNHDFLVDIYGFKSQLEQAKVKAMINKYKFSTQVRYQKNLKLTTKSYYSKIFKNQNIANIPKKVEVKYGIVTRRTSLRAFPTDEVSYKSTKEYEFDRFQETEIDILIPLAILHTSKDQKWFFVQMYNYAGWARASDIATVKSKWELSFLNSINYLVVTGSKIYSNLTPILGKLTKVPFQMGTIIPLVAKKKIKRSYYGQNPQLNFVALLPTRNSDGSLKVIETLIPTKSDVSMGHLPYTRRNIITQLFKMAGERYSWGGTEDGRDCSKLILDAFATFGLMLPRNSSQLKKIGVSQGTDLSKVKPGTMFYSKGHVMISLGRNEKRNYIIHSKSIFENQKKDKNQNVFSVLVSDLSVLPKGKKSILETREFTDTK